MTRKLLLAAAVFAAFGAPAAHAASFNCSHAKTSDEKAVCASRSLSEADIKMATLFEVDTRLVAMGTRGDIQDAQVAWLKSRRACGKSTTCLTKSYARRIKELQANFDAVASRGPF
ncbi:MAG: hypothetical protein WDN06_15530 [Asticcacaulis sp.]